MNYNKSLKAWSWINAVVFFMILIVNYMGAAGVFNGMSQKIVSDKYKTLITPAGFTFSIWGLIYLSMGIIILRIFLKIRDEDYRVFIKTASPFFLIHGLFNMGWIVSFSYEKIGLSVFMIIGLLFCLIQICKKTTLILKHGAWPIEFLAFGLYTGWVTIATVVNISAWLVKINWSRWGLEPFLWSSIVLVAALGLVTHRAMKLKNFSYTLAVAWAYFGIFKAHSFSGDFEGAYPQIQIVLGLGTFYLIGLSLYLFKNNLAFFKRKGN